MRNFFKNLVLFKFYLLSRIKRLTKFTPEVVVLMYHSVVDNNWKYSVAEKEFVKQIEFLRKNYHIVDLEITVEFIKGQTSLKDKTVALTFDDGYADNYKTVFPIIKKYKIPITIFLTTNLETSEKFGNLAKLSWEQIKEMSDSGLVTFQTHGHEHRNLKDISDDSAELYQEILTSRELIKEKINKNSEYFAYAAGHRNQKIIDYLKTNGFKAAFGINEGLIKPGRDIFNIKRVQVDKTINYFLFKLRLTNAVDLNRKFIDKVRKLYGQR